MWYRRVLVLLLLAECLWGFFPSYIFAYDEHTTHAALTDEIVDFYNLHFPDKVFTSEEKEWIVQGSIDEDLWPRWINHFYDPVYNEGWKAEEMGNLTPELALKLNTLLLSDYPPITSKSWAQSPERQAQYKQFGGNRTWQRAIYELAKNDNKKEAYYTLGHILHLLEDSTVPDHTRNDTHAHPLHLFTGDYGSPYEEYNKRYKRISDGTTISGTKAEVLYKNGVKPAYRQTLDNYFDVMAGYSNNYFFSKDTIPKNPLPTAPDRGTRKYNLPDVVDNDGEFGYGIDRGSAKFRLAKVTRQWNKQMKIYEDYYDLSDKPVYQPILDDYFSRLSREAITNGAGVIELFFAEVEKVKKGEEVIADLPKEKAGITSVLSTVTTVKQGYQTAKTSIKNAANVVSNKVTDIAGVVKIKLGFSTAKNEQKEAVVTVASVQPAPPSMQFPQSKPVQPAPKPKPVPKVQPVVKVPPPVVAPVQEVLGIKITNPDEVVPEVLPESVVSSTPLVLPSPFPTFFGGGGGGASAAQPPSQTTPSSPPSQGGDNQPPTLPTDSTPPSAPLLDALFADVWYTTTSVVTIFGTHSTDTVKVLVYVSPEPSPSVPLPKGEGVMTAPSDWGFAALLNAGRNHFYFGALDEANNTSSLSVPAVLVLDTEPPPVPVVTAVSDGATNVRVTVTGEDALSPVTRYDVEYATTTPTSPVNPPQGGIMWRPLATNTTTTEFDFAGTRGEWYVFRARAEDDLGNVSAWGVNCETSPSLSLKGEEACMTANPVFVNWSGEIVVNEIAWAGTSAQFPNDEWIELYNNTNQPIDLKNWKILVSGRQVTYNKVNNLIVPANGYFLLERSRDEAVKNIAADIVYTLAGGLNNGGEKIELIKPNGEKADEVDCSSGWFGGDNVKYRSMERMNGAVGGSIKDNWRSNESPRVTPRTFNGGEVYGSPKQSNFGFYPLNFRQEETNRVLTPSGNPYLLQYYEIPAGFTLTIEPGVIIKSYYADAKIDVYGTLVAKGDAQKPTVFTSGRDQSFSDSLWNTVVGNWNGANPAAKDWQGLFFRPGSSGELDGIAFRYAGKEFLPPNAGFFTPKVSQAIRVDQASVRISNTLFRDNGTTNIYLKGAVSSVVASVFSNGDRAVEAYDSEVTIRDSRFERFANAQGPIYVKGRWPELSDLTLSNNILNLPFLDQVSVTEAVELGKATPVHASSIMVGSTSTLTLNPGSAIYFAGYGFMDVKGTLLADGTPEEPVVVSALSSSTYWSNMTFTSSTSILRNVIIDHGNRLLQRPPESDGMLLLKNSTVTVENCVLTDVIDGNIVQEKDSKLIMRDCVVGQSVKPTFTTVGIKASGGEVHVDDTTFENLSIGLQGTGQPLPQLDMTDMTAEDFVNVDKIAEPAEWVAMVPTSTAP